ncbi:MULTISPECIES: hypothetical protein [Bacillus]|nr:MULTISPECIES: hypothetical protein [Bacillus]MCV4325845.1 hypothetical protein [Bacillus velezensis]MDH3093605.1 hypothetical protein [Bacillus velezensis]MDH3102267.1 hypothetical protein [Bacillus velezensis]RUS07669.1 hypothetical protein EFW58_00415 [Bacillus velezensis]WED87663.1 hypothetical protein PXG99_00755 [Bacillus velezensis]
MKRGFPPQHPVCPPPRVNAGYWYAFFVVLLVVILVLGGLYWFNI